jgi:hypothetical protein
MGELLAVMAKNGERRTQNAGELVSSKKELTDLGITKKRSSEAQRVAAMKPALTSAQLATPPQPSDPSRKFQPP